MGEVVAEGVGDRAGVGEDGNRKGHENPFQIKLKNKKMVKINKEKCSGCGNCIEVCPFGVLEIKNGKAVVKHPEKCKKCGACMSACPNNAIKVNSN